MLSGPQPPGRRTILPADNCGDCMWSFGGSAGIAAYLGEGNGGDKYLYDFGRMKSHSGRDIARSSQWVLVDLFGCVIFFFLFPFFFLFSDFSFGCLSGCFLYVFSCLFLCFIVILFYSKILANYALLNSL